jgi:hypothetical protein
MSKYSVEDWAIISSGSDLDDESNNDRLLEVDSIHLDFDTEPPDPSYPRDSVSSITTFMLPKVDDSYKLDDDSCPNPEPTIESSKCSVDLSNLEPDCTSLQLLPNENDIPISLPISSKIKFYENLSNLNESIKQKSDNFYQNFAKDRLDQLNSYVIRDQIPDNNDVDRIVDEDIVVVRNDVLDPKSSLCTLKKAFVYQPIWSFLKFLENHSRYLFYYAIVVCAIVASAAIYGAPYFMINKRKSTPLDKVFQVWDKMMYEDSTTSAKMYFWRQRKPKPNRILKYAQLLEVFIVKRTGMLKVRVLNYYDSVRDILEDFTISDKLESYVQSSKQQGEFYFEMSSRLYRAFETEFLKPIKEETVAIFHRASDIEFLRVNFNKLWDRTYSFSDGTLKRFIAILQEGLNNCSGYLETTQFYVVSGVNSLRRIGKDGLSKFDATKQLKVNGILSWLKGTMLESKHHLDDVMASIDEAEELALITWKRSYSELKGYINTAEENLDSVSIITAEKMTDVYKGVQFNFAPLVNIEKIKTNLANGKHHLDTVAVKIYRQSKTVWNNLKNN